MDWNSRLSIIKEIANCLNFLHQTFPTQKVPHGNLKSTNVLVVRNGHNNLRAKLSDYGLLPLLTSRRSTQRLAVARTPEFFEGRRLTLKADVYCFGIILLEVITGKIPGDNSKGGSSNKWLDDLSDWVRSVVDNDWSTDVLDVEIVSAREEHNDMLRLTEIALECTDVVPERRPRMSDVVRKIQDMEYIQISESRI